MPKKAQMWQVGLTFRYDKPPDKYGNCYPTPVVVVTRPEPGERPNNQVGILHIRSITPRAAARKFIKNNLVTILHIKDDGMYSPADLHGQTHVNKGNPKEEMKRAKKRASLYGKPVIEIRI
jgi:hypothetical protein